MNFKEVILPRVLLLLIIISIPILVLMSPLLKKGLQIPDYYHQLFEEAIVTEVISEEISDDPVITGMLVGKQELEVEILSGKYKGNTYTTVNPISQAHNVLGKKDLHLIVGIRETDDGPNVWVYNHKRENYIYLLGAIFFILLLKFGGWKGLNSIVSLVFTATVFIFVMIPMIFRGNDPIIVSITAVTVTSVISFLLIGGFKRKTLAAIAGTFSGIIFAGLISFVFGKLAHLSGINLEKGEQLVYIARDYQIHIKGLMFASILIASMGAVMDVAMSISSSIYELHQLDSSISFKNLLKSGMNIGKDIMGTMANTLILAFMGGSLGLMLLLWGYQMSYRQLMNMPFISVEIIQGLAGSIGIVLTVPFTAIIACFLYKREIGK